MKNHSAISHGSIITFLLSSLRKTGLEKYKYIHFATSVLLGCVYTAWRRIGEFDVKTEER